MKSKNTFTNNFNININKNFKNNKYINIVIITLIIGFSIYLLYFNDRIYVQDTITNSLNENNNDQDSLIENFDTDKYVDVCKNRNTHFYNVNPTLTEATNIDTCEKRCTDTSCHIFTFKDSRCYNYTGTLGDSKIDNNKSSSNRIGINCYSKIFPTNNSYNTGPYNGSGYINKNYFQNNKSNLRYIDPYLEESVNIIRDLSSIDNSRNQLASLDPLSTTFNANYNALRRPISDATENLFRKFTTMNTEIFDIPSDNSRNILYTDIFGPNVSNTILVPAISPTEDYLNGKDNITKKSDDLSGFLDATSKNNISNNLRYIILTIIMVITVIILILYKSSNFINEKILIVYIVIITFLVLFIRHHLKL
jgi:hypothetical protein